MMNEHLPYLEIDLQKIRNNYKILNQLCKGSKVAAAVKADAYGLGAEIISLALQKELCEDFFVARPEEGVVLRDAIGADANIFVLDGVFASSVKISLEKNLIPVLNNLGQIEIWRNAANNVGRRLPCVLHIDTGMNRLGIGAGEFELLLSKLDLLTNFDLRYIMSHLAASEDSHNPYNALQLGRFKSALGHFPAIKASFANSGGIFLGSDYHFDLVRPGIALYGSNQATKQEALQQAASEQNSLQNAVRLIAPIIHLQSLPIGSHIGYNMTYTTSRQTIIATLPLGYADGYLRAFSNKGYVWIEGYSAPVVGRVSMDLVNIDVTDIPSELVFVGQKVELIGEHYTPDKIAAIIGSISHEILTSFRNRYKRIYKEK